MNADGTGSRAGFLADLAAGIGRFSPLPWLFVIGGGACLLSMLAGLGYFVAKDGEMPRLSLYTLAEGEQFFSSGDLAAARREFEGVAAISPADTQNLVNLGVTAITAGDRELAARSFGEVLRYDADHPEASYFLGVMYLQANRLDDAISLIERAARNRSGPDAAPVWNDLGVAYARNGQPERAIECYRQALQLDPDFAGARDNLQKLRDRLAAGTDR